MAEYLAQYSEITESLKRRLGDRSRPIDRLSAEWAFAHGLCQLHEGEAKEWQALIVEAGRTVSDQLKASGTNAEELVVTAEKALDPIGKAAKAYTLQCVSHAHIDMNWMWSWPETVSVTLDTFRTMLTLLDEFPEYIFSQSQASVYSLVEKYDPAMFEAIRRQVADGRWEVTASQWVEGDKNMAAGESICRHLLYTREYFQEKFGLKPEDIRLDFEPDTFGHPATLPSILARGGVRYYYHCRGSHGPHLYWWIGQDDSRILALNGMPWYMGAIEPKIADPLPEFCKTTGMKSLPVFYGVGDHGGGPTRRDLWKLREMDGWPIYPNVKCSKLQDFFVLAENEAANVPEVRGERNFVFTGCYTSQARQKRANRENEHLLYLAETAAVLGDSVAGVDYPRANLESSWKKVLFDQFHDILPGSGIRETRHYTLGKAQEVAAAAGAARNNALVALALRVNTGCLCAADSGSETRPQKDAQESGQALGAGVGYGSGTGGQSSFSFAKSSERAFLIYNPLPHERKEVVTAKLWDSELDRGRLVVTGDGAEPKRVQVLDEGKYWGHSYLTVAFPVEVPPLGYRTVCVCDRLAELGLAEDGMPDYWAGVGGAFRRIGPPDLSMENEHLKVVLNPASGGISGLTDKSSGRQWVPEGKLSGIFEYCVEQNEGMTAWVIGTFMKRLALTEGGTLKRIHSGPYVETFRSTHKIGETKLVLDISLHAGERKVFFNLTTDWREIGDKERGTPNLRVLFPVEADQPEARYEIPFGSISRDLKNGEEVTGQRWADLSEKDGQGVALVNSSKYGFSLEGDTLSMTLLRASIDPDPLPDLGEHVIEYALVPHGEGWSIGRSTAAGEEANVPLVVLSCDTHEGDLPPVKSFVRVDNWNVRLAALKKAQGDDGIVLRLVEVEGKETEARVELAPELIAGGAEAEEVDTLERPTEQNGAALSREVLTVRVPAYGSTTVRIRGNAN